MLEPQKKRQKVHNKTISASCQTQKKWNDEVNAVNAILVDLLQSTVDLSTDIGRIRKDIKKLQKQREECLNKIKRLQQLATAQKKIRDKHKRAFKKMAELHPEDVDFVVKEAPGRPNVEMYFPGFGAVLMDIVNQCSMTDPRRRSKNVNLLCFIPSFAKEVRKRGYLLSNQTVITIITRKSEFKSHKDARLIQMPVKLLKRMEDRHKKHQQRIFCLEEELQIRQLASLLGT